MAESSPSPDPRRVIVPKTNRKEIVLALLAAALVLGIVGYGIFSLGTTSAKVGITGSIIEKKFEPREERQITIGAGNVRGEDIAGIYILRVRSREGEVYHVTVDKDGYDRASLGDEYLIPRSAVVGE